MIELTTITLDEKTRNELVKLKYSWRMRSFDHVIQELLKIKAEYDRDERRPVRPGSNNG